MPGHSGVRAVQTVLSGFPADRQHRFARLESIAARWIAKSGSAQVSLAACGKSLRQPPACSPCGFHRKSCDGGSILRKLNRGERAA
mmetsp:Transcript_85582/g.151532  ORF Transcript_85582/g.151532 Transcript_85582/m.151532 type:complete len:86 (-) Transcript_85582:15-272(-)